MVERHRSKDGSRDTEQFDNSAGTGSPGRAGGNLARKVGTRDEMKRATEDPAGVTRVRKSEEQTRDEKTDSDR